MSEGDNILNFAGPLGEASEIENYGTVFCVGGGEGLAPLYPIIKALKEAGNYVICILGARDKSLLMLEEEINEMLEEEINENCDELHIATDDGSKGLKGFVSDILQNLIDKEKRIDIVWAIGPVIMMKVVANLTKKYDIKTIVSLNPIMVDGTGMCGGCRGPEFDGHKVDFNNLMLRNRRFLRDEEEACKMIEETS